MIHLIVDIIFFGVIWGSRLFGTNNQDGSLVSARFLLLVVWSLTSGAYRISTWLFPPINWRKNIINCRGIVRNVQRRRVPHSPVILGINPINYSDDELWNFRLEVEKYEKLSAHASESHNSSFTLMSVELRGQVTGDLSDGDEVEIVGTNLPARNTPQFDVTVSIGEPATRILVHTAFNMSTNSILIVERPTRLLYWLSAVWIVLLAWWLAINILQTLYLLLLRAA